jgi:hypothetical protein
MDKHLYKMDVTTKRPLALQQTEGTFVNEPKALNWETWHKQYGHVRYSGLQKILEGKMVDGFNVDDQMDKPDCVTCTEAKQHIESFPKVTNRLTEPGELTHMDLWGKYAI